VKFKKEERETSEKNVNVIVKPLNKENENLKKFRLDPKKKEKNRPEMLNRKQTFEKKN